MPGIFKLCSYLIKKYKYYIIIITNQSGIGRGFYSEKNFNDLMKSIVFDFKKNDVEILDYFFSPYYIKYNNLNYRSCKNFLKRKQQRYDFRGM